MSDPEAKRVMLRIAQIGSARRECTDHVIVFNEEHLWRILSKYAGYYNEVRTHPAGARLSGSETLSRSRSLVGYTIDTHESEFSEATAAPPLRPDMIFGRHRA